MSDIPTKADPTEAAILAAMEASGDDYERGYLALASIPEAQLAVFREGWAARRARLRHLDRIRLKAAPRPIRVTGRSAVAAKALRVGLYDTWMLGDKPLGDATRLDLLGWADREEAVERGSARNKVFYRALAAKLHDDETPLRKGVPEAAADETRADTYLDPPRT